MLFTPAFTACRLHSSMCLTTIRAALSSRKQLIHDFFTGTGLRCPWSSRFTSPAVRYRTSGLISCEAEFRGGTRGDRSKRRC
ncbi:Uncharacterised protein [Mycobacteroides abscessus subsp. abscessus]|nr:Uncharacterised protein [Mycobacteroides abscessus subsp. abscessus]